METIQFLDALKICKNFIDNPSKENLDELENLKNSLVIRAYLPMQEKVVTLYKVGMESDKSIELASTVFTAALEMSLVFTGLLSYTNIDIMSVPKEIKVYETYDALMQSGLVDYILQYCEKDYNRLTRMMERTLSYENLMELVDSVNGIQSEPIRESIEEFRKFRESMSPEMIHDIADITRFNDPHLYQIKEDIVDDALACLERMDRMEKINIPAVEKKTAE